MLQLSYRIASFVLQLIHSVAQIIGLVIGKTIYEKTELHNFLKWCGLYQPRQLGTINILIHATLCGLFSGLVS